MILYSIFLPLLNIVGVMEGKFLKEGDVLTTSIEGLGSLENVCKRITNHSGVE